MTIEERLKRIEDALGMTWGCRASGFVTFDEMQRALDEAKRTHGIQPKQATIKIGPMHPRCADMIVGTLDGVGGITVKTTATYHPHDVHHTKHTLTITGPAE